ncbi:hypothetical protein D3C85_1232480 [compost metagenome]
MARWALPVWGRLANVVRVPSLWFGAAGIRRRASSSEQAKFCKRVRLIRPSSKSQNFWSNAALCASKGVVPTNSFTSFITCSADGAVRSMALLMPVSCSMKAGTRTPAFIRLW